MGDQPWNAQSSLENPSEHIPNPSFVPHCKDLTSNPQTSKHPQPPPQIPNRGASPRPGERENIWNEVGNSSSPSCLDIASFKQKINWKRKLAPGTNFGGSFWAAQAPTVMDHCINPEPRPLIPFYYHCWWQTEKQITLGMESMGTLFTGLLKTYSRPL